MRNMSRTAILSVASLIILCLSVSQISLSFASYSSSPINTSGIIKEKVELTRIRKHIVAYGSSPATAENQEHIARFDIVDIDFYMGQYATRIKELNPNIVILGYRDIMMMHSSYDDWEEVDPHEDWFLHDIHGNRLVHKRYGCYAMDVGNLGWQSHYANYVKSKLDRYPAFDGVFADDTWDEWYTYRYEEWTVPPEDIPPEIGQR